MSLRVAVVGGGPGGLFLATLLCQADPTARVTVYERNRAEDAFGFGVVFSDRTLAAIHDADPVLREGLRAHGRHWDEIEVRLKGERIRCGGNGMAAIERRRLLALLQASARSAGASLCFSTEVGLADLGDVDLVVAADGTGSRLRTELEPRFASTVEVAEAKYVWFGTDYLFDGLTFLHERGPHGVFAVHGYPISDAVSTFIVETDERSWRAAGLDSFDDAAPPGVSDLVSKAYLERLFAEQIEGRQLLVNNSRWGNFRTRRTARWWTTDPQCVALLGDAAHTAHFSVGSGTKMAMEDAIALSAALVAHPGDVPAALAAYELAAKPSVDAIQASAGPSLSWWEHFGDYYDAFEPWQFAYHFLSRSISDARLARRAPLFVAAAHGAWEREHGTSVLSTPLPGALPLPQRLLTLSPDGLVVRAPACQVGEDRVLPAAPGTGPWAAPVLAPDTVTDLPAAFQAVRRAVADGAAMVAVHGGTAHTRTLLCEHVRLVCGLPAVLVDLDADLDSAVTAVLSGRADAVAVGALVAEEWQP